MVQRMQGRPFLTASTMCAVIFSHFLPACATCHAFCGGRSIGSNAESPR